MGRRYQLRTKMVLPVRVWGMDSNGRPFTELAHTLDVTPTGARLGGLRRMLSLGDVVGVQYRHQKGRFKVAWIGRPGSSDETHVGIESLDKEKKLWGLDLPEGSKDEYKPPEAKPVDATRPGLRSDQRFRVSGEVELQSDTGDSVTGNLMDISLSGCYVEGTKLLPLQTPVQCKLVIHGTPVDIPGVVRTRHPGVGMGVEFTEGATTEETEGLKTVLRRLQAAEKEPMPPAKAKPDSTFLSSRLKNASKELLELDELMKTTPLDPLVLREFRDSLGHVRTTAWAVQRWIELQTNQDDPFPVIKYLNTERIRLASRMCEFLRDDMRSMELRVQRKELDRLLHSVESLFTHLAGLDVDVIEQQALAEEVASDEIMEIEATEESLLTTGNGSEAESAAEATKEAEEAGEAAEEGAESEIEAEEGSEAEAAAEAEVDEPASAGDSEESRRRGPRGTHKQKKNRGQR